MIKVIGFDGNGVLYYRDTDFTDALMRYIRERHLPDFDLEGGAELQLKLMRDAFSGGISKDESLRRFLDAIGILGAKEREDILRKERELSRRISLFPGEKEALLQLEHRGFKLGMITNSYQSASEKASWFRGLGLDCIASTIVSSIDAGVAKPDVGIYLEFSLRVGFAPWEIAFVGHEKSELDGAREAGMLPISFNCSPKIREQTHLEKFADLVDLFQSPGLELV